VVAKDVSHIPAADRKFTYIDEISVEDVFAAVKDLLTHPVRGTQTGCVKGERREGA
jgi:hypothetical protein